MCTCYICGLTKPREEFSNIDDIYQCINPEDVVCDVCYEEAAQAWITKQDLEFDEWCLTV